MQDRSGPSAVLPPFVPGREAVDLLPVLDRYETASSRLVDSWFEPDAYANFSAEIDAIREQGLKVAPLTLFSLQLLIAHSELVSAMWQLSAAAASPAQVQAVRKRHAIAVQALREMVVTLRGSA